METTTTPDQRTIETEEWSAIVLEPDGSERPATITWIRERTPFTRRDGTAGHHKNDRPEGYEGTPAQFGSPDGSNCELYREAGDGHRHAVIASVGDRLELYLCPSLRSAVALIREFLPLIEFEVRYPLVDALHDHLSGCCDPKRQACIICDFLAALKGRRQ